VQEIHSVAGTKMPSYTTAALEAAQSHLVNIPGPANHVYLPAKDESAEMMDVVAPVETVMGTKIAQRAAAALESSASQRCSYVMETISSYAMMMEHGIQCHAQKILNA
jgi:hypothetical protein